MGFSGPSHDQEESNVIAILLRYMEEEMHYSVRHGAFQASSHSDPVNLRDCFCIYLSSNCPTDLTVDISCTSIVKCHSLPPLYSGPPCYKLFLYYDLIIIATGYLVCIFCILMSFQES